MQDINIIMNKLDWNSSKEDKIIGIGLAKKVQNLSYFMQPCDSKYNKNVWEGCAMVINEKTDKELEPYIEQLLEWLQDANWPGFNIIFDRLSIMNAELLIDKYVYCVEKALKEDYEWLNYLSGLIKNKKLYNLLPVEQKKLLKKYYKNYWYTINQYSE